MSAGHDGFVIDRTRRKLLDFDRDVLLAAAKLRSPLMDAAMRATTRAGDAETWLCVAAFLLLSSPHVGLLVAGAALFATIVSAPLKRLCRRSRPRHGIVGFRALTDDPDAFSFPSGHSATAWAVAFALSGEPASPLAFGLALAVSLSRVYLGAHYPLDVAAGAVIGTACGIAIRVLA